MGNFETELFTVVDSILQLLGEQPKVVREGRSKVQSCGSSDESVHSRASKIAIASADMESRRAPVIDATSLFIDTRLKR